uniref:Uncharacterized protein n=1 Tax=Arion vulgaris TaxID=1028688 RepID=A0A0B6Y0H7_9EUPU
MPFTENTYCHDIVTAATNSSDNRMRELEDIVHCSLTSDQIPTSSSSIADTPAQTGTSCTSCSALPSVTDSTQDLLKHSNQNRSISCLPPREYQAAVQLEYGTHILPPPTLLPAFNLPTASSNECDV